METSDQKGLKTLMYLRISAEAAWAGVGPVLSAVGGLALLKTQGVLLAPSEMGSLLLSLNIVSFIQGFLVAGQSSAAIRFASLACTSGQGRAFMGILLRLIVARGVILVPLAIMSLCVLVLGGAMTPLMAAGAFVLGLLQAGSAMIDGWILSHRRQKLFSLILACTAIFRVIGVVAFVRLSDRPEGGALLGLIFATAVVLSLQIGSVIKDVGPNPANSRSSGRDWLVEAKFFARPFLGWTIIGWTQAAAERWSLSGWRGEASVGIYGAAAQLCNAPANILSTVISNYAMPRLSGSWDQRDPTRRELLNWLYVAGIGAIIILGAAFCSAIFGEYFIRALLSERYVGVEKFLPILILSSGAFALGQAMTNPLVVINPGLINRAKWVSPIIGAVLAICLVPIAGIWGVAAAALTSNVIYVFWLSILLMGRLPLAVEVGKSP